MAQFTRQSLSCGYSVLYTAQTYGSCRQSGIILWRQIQKNIAIVEQNTINQRLKFLVDQLGLSSRAFSEIIGESPTNTHNYIGTRQAEPRASYLINVLSHFSNVSPGWLMTGEGEPFIVETQGSTTQTGKFNQAGTRNKQTNTVNKGSSQATSGQETQLNAALESANKEIALLREQLAMKDQLIAAKEEMLSLLRSQFNRPN
ncbi:helix-turn-helix domain-containing protein [Hymenobacter sp. 5317J-9]|uniref:helix-turn-helix domain-containing protein n=1 Tax=Hymenobacter sp. 5317J-9 TaxID=2932250 RepID=UPI001FD6E525|nr:helix-turn-helix transcriptional regulator [Hymenobacter sp. 5317J-9]UOQ99875.1 helix-turn-helix domain-containing protein [Hymenobacter sp. 5317J-9]